MASPRLPIPGDDSGTWGEILNEFLLVSHNGDGSIRAGAVPASGTPDDNSVSTATLQDGSVTEPKLAVSNAPANGNVLTWTGSDLTWQVPASAPVSSVAGKTGAVALTKGDVGLTNVDNTSDLGKPISTAIQGALNDKADIGALAPVATSGSYDDLIDTPAIPVAGTSGSTFAAGNDARITGAIQASTATTKGDILAATGSSAFNRVGIGSNGQVLEVDSTQATGLKWATPASAPVSSVAGKTGAVTLTASDVSGLSTIASTGAYTDISGTPTLSTVAVTGAYADLTGTPAIPTAGTSGSTYAAGNDARITGAVQLSTYTTKGDLLAATGSGAVNRLPAGTNGQVLEADSTQANGVKWATPASAPVTSVAGKTGIVTLAAADVSGLSTVAITGVYTDLTGRPTLSAVATSGAYTDLSGRPALTTVATSGSYDDLTNKPTIPTAGTSGSTYAAGNDTRITGAFQTSTVTTKGDLLAGTGSAAINRVPVGADGYVLTADSAEASGVKWSAVAGGSGITRSIVTVSSNQTASAAANTDYVYIIAGAHTLTLPAAVSNTNMYTIKNRHSASVSLAFNGSENADGGSITLATNNSVNLVSDGSNWVII